MCSWAESDFSVHRPGFCTLVLLWNVLRVGVDWQRMIAQLGRCSSMLYVFAVFLSMRFDGRLGLLHAAISAALHYVILCMWLVR